MDAADFYAERMMDVLRPLSRRHLAQLLDGMYGRGALPACPDDDAMRREIVAQKRSMALVEAGMAAFSRREGVLIRRMQPGCRFII